jgi:uncharacterized protein
MQDTKPWGYFATLGWGVLVFLVGQIAGAIVLYVWAGSVDNLADTLKSSPNDGVALSIGTYAADVVMVALLWQLAALRGRKPAEYLALTVPTVNDVTMALKWLVVLIVAGDLLMYLSGQPLVPAAEVEAYQSARAVGWLPGLAVAVMVVAPISEEILFRGFLFRGWAQTAREARIAIPVTALIFASLHLQYDIFGMAQILALGLFLGWVRWGSGSTLLTILCHAVINIESSIETVIKVYWFS